jgi:hypothetical protein
MEALVLHDTANMLTREGSHESSVVPELEIAVLAENTGRANCAGPGLSEDPENLTVEGLFEEHRDYVWLEAEGLRGCLIGKLNARSISGGIFVFGFGCHLNS